MSSSYLNIPDLLTLASKDGAGELLLRVKRTSNARDVREALMELAYAIQASRRAARGLCVVMNTRLSAARLEQELARFRQIVQPRLGRAVFLAALQDDGQWVGELPDHGPDMQEALRTAMGSDATSSAGKRVSRQHIKAMVVERWLCQLPPLSIAELRRQSGASHPTIAAALAELQALGVMDTDTRGRYGLHRPSWPVLRKLAEEHAAARQVMRFVDPGGLARLPDAMAGRLMKLAKKQQEVGIGGVLGALRYVDDLDITAAPRLDVSVYDGDTRFVQRLDAGLLNAEQATGQHRVVLVLHLQRDCRPPDARGSGRAHAASALDCLADLLETGLQAEAEEFAHALTRARAGQERA